jgi:hypothetical protein
MAFFFANLGIARRHMDRTAEAEELFKRAIAAARLHKHRSLGPSLADLAEIQCSTGRTAEGLKLLDEAAEAVKRDYPDDAWRAAWVENVRGECLLRAGRRADSKRAVDASAPAILDRWPAGTLFAVEARRRLALVGG